MVVVEIDVPQGLLRQVQGSSVSITRRRQVTVSLQWSEKVSVPKRILWEYSEKKLRQYSRSLAKFSNISHPGVMSKNRLG